MAGRPLHAGIAVFFVALAGCAMPLQEPPPLAPAVADLESMGVAFAAPVLLDPVRAGGEPAVIVTPKGTILVATHPGYTHFNEPDSDLATGNSGQTYMWRSTDGGKSWSFVGLPRLHAGPRNGVPSISDPDFSMDAAGNLYYSDLYLADISVQKSSDDGETWLQGNPLVTHQPALNDPSLVPGTTVDRNWIVAGEENVVHAVWQEMGRMLGGMDRGMFFATSTDGGITFPQKVHLDVEYDLAPTKLVLDPDGAVLMPLATPDGVALARSEDGGRSWQYHPVHATKQRLTNLLPWAASDGSGAYYVAWSEGETAQRVSLAISRDKGASWTPALPLSKEGYTSIFPFVVAGDEGRVAVLWLEAHEAAKPNEVKGPWHVHAVFSHDALAPVPSFAGGRIAPDNHEGSVCMQGVGCALATPRGDRRLGDYFTAALDPEGRLVVAYADTTAGGGISHPVFVKQVAGPGLFAPS